MSDQTTREAAARAWFDVPCLQREFDLRDALRNGSSGYYWPNGATAGSDVGLLSMWLAHVRALDAKPAPVDALEGVVWRDAGKMAEWAELPTYTSPIDFGVDSEDHEALIGLRASPSDRQLAAHARAQLARESAPTAPVAPAMTLDAMREALDAMGYRVSHKSGHDDPGAVLTALLVGVTLSEEDAHAVTCNLSLEDAAHAEIARLRALGVTPAVLS